MIEAQSITKNMMKFRRIAKLSDEIQERERGKNNI